MREMRKKWQMKRMMRKMMMSRWHSNTRRHTCRTHRHTYRLTIVRHWPTDNWQKMTFRKIGKIPLFDTCRWSDKQNRLDCSFQTGTLIDHTTNNRQTSHSSLILLRLVTLFSCVDCFLLLIPSLIHILNSSLVVLNQQQQLVQFRSPTCSWPSLCHLTNRISHHLTSLLIRYTHLNFDTLFCLILSFSSRLSCNSLVCIFQHL